MLLLDADVDGATDSTVFKTTTNGKVWVWIYATTFGSITMKCSPDNSTYRSFYPDGVVATYTTEFARLYDLPGGLFWKFTGNATTDSAVIYISGTAATLSL